MKKILIITTLFMLLSAFKVYNPEEHFTFDKKVHDFGNIEQGYPVNTMFIITNIGEEPLMINTVNRQCGCTTPKYKTDPILKGQKDTIWVGYNAATAGSFTKKLTVITNFGESDLIIRGTVTTK